MKKQEFVGEQIHRTKNELRQEIEGIVGKDEFERFKQFALKKSMVEMAVAFMLGASFNKVIKAISDNIVMPTLNFFLSKTGQNWRDYIFEPVEDLQIELGVFAGALVDFFLIAIVLYIIYRKIIVPFANEEEKPKIKCIDTKKCDYCFQEIYFECKRCPLCTSWLNGDLSSKPVHLPKTP